MADASTPATGLWVGNNVEGSTWKGMPADVLHGPAAGITNDTGFIRRVTTVRAYLQNSSSNSQVATAKLYRKTDGSFQAESSEVTISASMSQQWVSFSIPSDDRPSIQVGETFDVVIHAGSTGNSAQYAVDATASGLIWGASAYTTGSRSPDPLPATNTDVGVPSTYLWLELGNTPPLVPPVPTLDASREVGRNKKRTIGNRSAGTSVSNTVVTVGAATEGNSTYNIQELEASRLTSVVGQALSGSSALNIIYDPPDSTITTSDNLNTVLSSANDGDIIQMASGDYGDWTFTGYSFSPPVTMVGADPGNRPIMTPTLDQSTGIIFKYINFDGSVSINQGTNISFYNCSFLATTDQNNVDIVGDLATPGATSSDILFDGCSLGPADRTGQTAVRNLNAKWVTELTVRNCSFNRTADQHIYIAPRPDPAGAISSVVVDGNVFSGNITNGIYTMEIRGDTGTVDLVGNDWGGSNVTIADTVVGPINDNGGNTNGTILYEGLSGWPAEPDTGDYSNLVDSQTYSTMQTLASDTFYRDCTFSSGFQILEGTTHVALLRCDARADTQSKIEGTDVVVYEGYIGNSSTSGDGIQVGPADFNDGTPRPSNVRFYRVWFTDVAGTGNIDHIQIRDSLTTGVRIVGCRFDDTPDQSIYSEVIDTIEIRHNWCSGPSGYFLLISGLNISNCNIRDNQCINTFVFSGNTIVSGYYEAPSIVGSLPAGLPTLPSQSDEPATGTLIQQAGFGLSDTLTGEYALGGWWHMIPVGGSHPNNHDVFMTYSEPAVPDGVAAKITIDDGYVPYDHDTTERTEVSCSNDNATEGDTVVVAFYAKVDTQFATLNQGRWQVGPHQQHGTHGGPPPLAFEFQNGNHTIEIHHNWNGSILTSNTTIFSTPVDYSWHRWVYRCHLSSSSSQGWVEVWRDGVQMQMLNGQNRYYIATVAPGEGWYAKGGLYRNDSFSGRNIVHLGPLTIHTAA